MLIVVATIVVVALVIYFWPYISKLQDEAYQEEFHNWVKSFGPWGVIVLLLTQVLQIIVFFIPGELIELSCGLLYGVIGGYLVCTAGQILAILFVYFLYKLFGNKLILKMVDKETIEKMEKNTTRAEVVLFFSLLIPGIPKDVFNFVAPYCKIPMWKFIVISLIARFPSVFSSILVGAAIIEGNFNISLIVLVISGIIGILGIIFNKKIVQLIEKVNQKNSINRTI